MKVKLETRAYEIIRYERKLGNAENVMKGTVVFTFCIVKMSIVI